MKWVGEPSVKLFLIVALTLFGWTNLTFIPTSVIPTWLLSRLDCYPDLNGHETSPHRKHTGNYYIIQP